MTTLVALRMLIGWHFCYEGIAKLLNPYWTSAGYLAGSQWFLKDELIDLADECRGGDGGGRPERVGPRAIGLGLLLGALARPAAIAGVVLLSLYWIVAPPFAGVTYPMPAEGSYVLVNKVLVELAALLWSWRSQRATSTAGPFPSPGRAMPKPAAHEAAAA